MAGNVRPARAEDIPRIIELAERRRDEYERAQPIFWRKAEGSAEKHSRYLANQLQRSPVLALVYERDGVIEGFVIGELTPPPPVYDPGGDACVIDGFAVAQQIDWGSIGLALLDAVSGAAKARGAVQTIVVCGRHDEPKRRMLASFGAGVVSEWWLKSV